MSLGLVDEAVVACELTQSDDDREQIYELNARRVFPRLDARLKARNGLVGQSAA